MVQKYLHTRPNARQVNTAATHETLASGGEGRGAHTHTQSEKGQGPPTNFAPCASKRPHSILPGACKKLEQLASHVHKALVRMVHNRRTVPLCTKRPDELAHSRLVATKGDSPAP
ncbi:hypothetical protein TRVL_08496 [Trypanosoma vivax]|nr:hypothetical protein TRVL_08496 [Trypanosoma vivax]